MMRDPTSIQYPTSIQSRRRTGLRYTILLFIVFALAAGWTAFWKFAAGRADQLGQAPLDIHVNVFVCLGKHKFSVVDFAPNGFQASDDLLRVTHRNDALLPKHFSMRNTAQDIVTVKPRIDGNRRSECFDGIRRLGGEAPAPELFLFAWQSFQSSLTTRS